MKNIPFFPSTIVEIEIFADTISCIIYGKLKYITKLKDILNTYSEKNNINKKYIISKLNFPVAKLCDIQEDNYNKLNKTNIKFNFNNSLETIQCMVYAECNNKDAKNMYSILCIEKINSSYEINYPSIELKENFDPEDMIYKEMKKINPIYAKYIKKNIKLLDITGGNDEILVYSCKLDDIEKKIIKI